MTRVLLALALALALALPPAAAQEDPLAPPAPRPTAPPPAAPGDEAALRREVGALLLAVAARRTTPQDEHALLDLAVERDGRPFDRARRVEVSVRRRGAARALRLRFREPAALRDEAWLVVAGPAGVEARRYDPRRRRAERVAVPEPTWRVGGSGLLFADLWPDPDEDEGQGAGAAGATLLHDDRVRPDGTFVGAAGGAAAAVTSDARAVRVVEAASPLRAVRRLVAVDRERQVPLLLSDRDAAGGEVRRAVLADWRWVAGVLRPFAATVLEPRDGQTTRVTAAWRQPAAPPAHFDPDRFWE